jgi:hypothetical protein
MSGLEFSQLLGNYGEFVGAIAIVITLIYLAVQLKQNTESVRAGAYQAWVAANVDINVAFSNPFQSQMIANGNADPTALTEESYGGYVMLHLAMLQMAQSVDYLYRSGSLDRELWEAEMNRAAGILTAPGVRQLWDAGIKTQLAPNFVKRLEATPSTIAYVNWDSQRGFFHDEQITRKGELDSSS